MRLKQGWWLVLALPVLLGLAQMHFDVEVLDLLPPDEPAVQGLKLYQQHFANARELIITLRENDADKVERLARDLAERLRRETNLVTSVSWQPPWMEQPAQVAELAAYLWFNQPPDVFGTLTNRLQPKNLGPLLAETKFPRMVGNSVGAALLSTAKIPELSKSWTLLPAMVMY